ncbi:hypothetical protein DLAC_04726 [Tieghemostelium lacteum]|uniref:Uncharacterized protein n=1 Tax=Tieghemostelium lacteum TaxID=361077 RepID=A0A151ZKJ9_TIELA|nr:hypothetical protein DLAC_04726 [Tieghemostelium lacteum]|eukprot:KYQ94429.1 hypothetical protein DLAC_04726 [Tieghemostelium lacteum]
MIKSTSLVVLLCYIGIVISQSSSSSQSPPFFALTQFSSDFSCARDIIAFGYGTYDLGCVNQFDSSLMIYQYYEQNVVNVTRNRHPGCDNWEYSDIMNISLCYANTPEGYSSQVDQLTSIEDSKIPLNSYIYYQFSSYCDDSDVEAYWYAVNNTVSWDGDTTYYCLDGVPYTKTCNPSSSNCTVQNQKKSCTPDTLYSVVTKSNRNFLTMNSELKSMNILQINRNQKSLNIDYNNGSRYYFKSSYVNLSDNNNKDKDNNENSKNNNNNRGTDKETKEGDFTKAIELLGKAIQIGEKDSRAYSLRAFLYSAEEQYQQAIDDYLTLLELNPDDVRYLSGIADCYASIGDFEKAMKCFHRVLHINPSDLAANGNLGDIYLKNNELEKALSHYKTIVSVDPKNLNGLVGLGHLAMKQGNLDNAAALYQQVIKLTQNQKKEILPFDNKGVERPIEEQPVYGATICLANIYSLQNKPEESYKLFKESTVMSPQNAFSYAMMAAIQSKLGNLELALQHITKSLELNPQNDFNKVIQGDVYFDMGRYPEAIQAYKSVAANLIERDAAEEVVSRVSLFHNLVSASMCFLRDLSTKNDINLSVIVDPKETEQFEEQPPTLYELSKKSKALSEFLVKLPQLKETFPKLPNVTEEQFQVTKTFIVTMIETLHYIVLTCNEMIQYQHKQSTTNVQIDNPDQQAPIPDLPVDESVLFSHYEDLSNALKFKFHTPEEPPKDDDIK